MVLLLAAGLIGCKTAALSQSGAAVRISPSAPVDHGFEPKSCKSLGYFVGRGGGSFGGGYITNEKLVAYAMNDLRNQAAQRGANYVQHDSPQLGTSGSDGASTTTTATVSGTAYRCARRRDDDAGERRPAGKVWEAKTAGNKDLNMKVTAVSVTLLMRTIPATTPDIAVFAKLRDRRQYGECSLVLAADGARVELERRTDLVGYLGAAIDLKTLSSVAAATRVAGRLCDQEFVLEPGALTVLRDFVLRVRETTALLPSPSASPAEEVVDVAPAAPAVQGEITQP